jgi:hypothetical protein
MVSDWSCLKYFACFLYRNHQVHRDVLITLYFSVVRPCKPRLCNWWRPARFTDRAVWLHLVRHLTRIRTIIPQSLMFLGFQRRAFRYIGVKTFGPTCCLHIEHKIGIDFYILPLLRRRQLEATKRWYLSTKLHDVQPQSPYLNTHHHKEVISHPHNISCRF